MPLSTSPPPAMDPITDPNDPNYDATKDPNSPQYQSAEQSQPSGEQDATLPGATSETSTQIPKEGEQTSAGGKSPLQFDPNAPAVPMVAQPDQMRVEGSLDEGKSAQDQVYSSAIAPQRAPDAAWQEYAVQAINGLYPRLRNGVDFAVGRKTLAGDVELLHNENDAIDWGKVQEAAKKLVDANPYVGEGYQPKPGLAPPMDKGASQGEVPYQPNRELPPNVAQSEVNPQTQDKVPSQASPV